VGAAFALVLEEKMALGLAAPPRERVPVESLSEEALVRRAIEEREERARTGRMTIRSMNPVELWTDYLVTNAAAGKTYRVALRGWDRGESYCSCPDFRKNTLGTCKHILNVTRKVKRRFPAAVRDCAFEPTGTAWSTKRARYSATRTWPRFGRTSRRSCSAARANRSCETCRRA